MIMMMLIVFLTFATPIISPDSQKLHVCDKQNVAWEELDGTHALLLRHTGKIESLDACKSLCMTKSWCVAINYNSQTSICIQYRKGHEQTRAGRNENIYLRKCLSKSTVSLMQAKSNYYSSVVRLKEFMHIRS
ncbi:hypothetical protein EG68_10373 [Paragonimus skrjabini miyazakii]|uniref:Apple domain-containing protein n=1 Tax=Paragonimus skrjabini miyazakii TaxID=59628 RepID=A0A8S9YFU8_9TREM|nr:hypothetical protein EG68_10373 [Paragonimus skrjabini miyazakii]